MGQVLAETALRESGGAPEVAALRNALIRLLTTDTQNRGAIAPFWGCDGSLLDSLFGACHYIFVNNMDIVSIKLVLFF